MRIARLELAAFGPFTERVLDFSAGAPGGLHLVYGKNAAGKSTALRAIGDLLFGIPAKTSDDHVHPYQALRIRACLEDGRGQRRVVQRLKRNKDALRDEADSPLDEGVLAAFLTGVDRDLFERVFGLDHERLREAGQTLLKGGGDVGESLFDAGAGGHGVRRVLERLEAEADGRYKARGKHATINELLERYKEARKRVGDALRPPEAYVEQLANLEQVRAERDQLLKKLTELREERFRKRELQGALKSIARRAQLLSELTQLGPVPDVSEAFSERRERVQETVNTERAALAAVERDLERLSQQRAAISVPDGLLLVGEAAMRELNDGIGRTRKALADLPDRESELGERRVAAALMAERLGGGRVELEKLSRVGSADEARVRKLLGELNVLAERHRGAESKLAEAERALAVLEARRARLAPSEDVEPLERALSVWRSSGDVEQSRAAVLRERAELGVRMSAELALLSPYTGTAEGLVALRVPDVQTVARFERRFAEQGEQSERERDAAERVRLRLAALEQEIAAETRAGGVPSEEELELARAERDRGFGRLREDFDGRAADYRSKVDVADQLADRLRREAARVAEHARRAAEREALERERELVQRRRAELTQAQKELGGEWHRAFREAGFEPLAASEMASWLGRRARLCELVQRDAGLGARAAELEQTASELGRALDAALGPGSESSLATRAARAAERLDGLRRQAADRAALSQQVADAESAVLATRRELEKHQRAERERHSELESAVVALGIEPGLSLDEIDARLQTLVELGRAHERILDLERRIAGIKRDAAAFEAQVRRLVQAHAPDLAELPSDEAAEALRTRHQLGLRDREVLERLLPELADREREQSAHRALIETAGQELAELMRVAGARDVGELLILEARARKARERTAELANIEALLGEVAGARGLGALLAEAEGLDGAELAARLEELEQLIPELEQQYPVIADRVAGYQLGLERFALAEASEAAEEEQALAASLRGEAQRYARARLAAVLLRREIERYREQNQGPVLRRASELFAELTRGEYQALRVGREEKSIVALRRDLEVGIEGLNEAARYHLYLALRVASLERYLEHAEPLPLVLDDVLIHFDDDGARAALGVIGALSTRLQVLLFTHHQHNVALAREAVKNAPLFLHEL